MCNMPCNSRVWLVLYNNMFARTRAHVMYGPKKIKNFFKRCYYSYYAITPLVRKEMRQSFAYYTPITLLQSPVLMWRCMIDISVEGSKVVVH